VSHAADLFRLSRQVHEDGVRGERGYLLHHPHCRRRQRFLLWLRPAGGEGHPRQGNWFAQHSAGVMADLEALARSRASRSHSLSYPIRNGQVGAPGVYCRVQLLGFFFATLLMIDLGWSELFQVENWHNPYSIFFPILFLPFRSIILSSCWHWIMTHYIM
jgi:hypothetical protein